MRETQILRGLHKARAGHYADGVVPAAPPPTSLRGIGNAVGKWFTHNPALDKPAAAAPAPAPAPAPTPTQTGISGYVGNSALDKRMAAAGLSRGTAYLHGAGTGTSDSIPAMLSKGEAVLPAKTVQKMGAHNIARLIHQTNGKPPKQGLRGAVHAAAGFVWPDNMPNDINPAAPVEGAPMGPAKPKVDINKSWRTASNAGPSGMGAAPAATAGTTAGLGAEDINFSSTKPTPEPAPKGFMNRAKAFGNGATETATGLKSGAMKFGGRALGTAGGVLGAGMETANAVGDMNAPGMTTDDKLGRAGEGAMRMAAGIGGAQALGAVGAAAGPVGAAVGGLAGGALGYFSPDLLASGLRAVGMKAELPSERAASLRKAAAAAPAASAVEAPAAPLGGGQTAETFARTGGLNNPQQGAGRGRVNPLTGGGDRVDTGYDLSGELNKVPAQLPTNMAEGAVYKTVDPRTGRTTYSGRNVGFDTNGLKMVNGMGDALQPRGSMQQAAAGAPIGITPSGNGAAFTPSGLGGAQGAQPQGTQPSAPQARGGLAGAQTGVGGTPPVTAALQAAVARGDTDAVRRFYQQEGGTFQGRTASQDAPEVTPQSLLMQRIQQGLAAGQSLTPAGVAALQNLNTTDKNYRATMAGHDVSRQNNIDNVNANIYGTDIGLRKSRMQLDYDRQVKGVEWNKQGADALDSFIKQDPNTHAPGKDGKPPEYDPQKGAAFSKYLSETVPGISDGKGGTMSVQQAFALNNPAARDVVQKQSNEFALREFANDYSKGSLLGKGGAAGRLQIKSLPRGIDLGDLAHDTHLADYLTSKAPFINGQGVEIAGLGGKSITVPLREIIAQPNGRAMLEAINRMSPAQ